MEPRHGHLLLPSGELVAKLERSGNGQTKNMLGYLVDEDYFSSASSGSNSNATLNLEGYNQTILFQEIPGFIDGELFDTIVSNQSSYTVPEGKQLFM